ncbi:MAG TPA: hypothetical protein VI997_07950 [Candidatus Thermoplasmatota archaeon]|nr:hypothetical protein [Candidatus Thermoplasmatota archaeon]
MRKKRTNGPIDPSEPTERTPRSDRSHRERLTLDEYGRLARLARERAPPPALVSYALGGQVMTNLHVSVDAKLAFEDLRAEVRAELGWPVTQPGMFALLVSLAERHASEVQGLARAGVGR